MGMISLSMVHGDSKTWTVRSRIKGTTTPIDLTGSVFSGSIRKEYSTDVLINLTFNPTDLVNGEFTMSISSINSSSLPQNSKGLVNSFVFDVQREIDGKITTMIRGYLKVANEVTL